MVIGVGWKGHVTRGGEMEEAVMTHMDRYKDLQEMGTKVGPRVDPKWPRG